MAIKTEYIIELTKLTNEIKDLQLKIDLKRQRVETLQSIILDDFVNNGIKNVKLSGVGTVYIHRSIRCKIKNDSDDARNEISKVLREEGLGYLIYDTFNLNSLSAAMRERIGTKDTDTFDEALLNNVPKSIRDLVDVFPDYSIRIKK